MERATQTQTPTQTSTPTPTLPKDRMAAVPLARKTTPTRVRDPCPVPSIITDSLTRPLGLDAAEKKFGLPENRAVNEKITDYSRDTYEKDTG